MVTALASKVKRVFHHILRVRAEAYNNWDNSRHRSRTRSVAQNTLHRTRNKDFPAQSPRRCLTGVKLQATVYPVKIRNFAHKGLQRLYLEDNPKGVPPDTTDKLRKMFAYLDDIEGPEELSLLTAWKPHTLTGDRKGEWSLSVTRNRRLTFRVDAAEREICDVNLEDYH